MLVSNYEDNKDVNYILVKAFTDAGYETQSALLELKVLISFCFIRWKCVNISRVDIFFILEYAKEIIPVCKG